MKKLIVLGLFLLLACESENFTEQQLTGYAQGSTFHITLLAPANAGDFQREIDSIFRAIDQSLSTYQPTSLISRANRGDSIIPDRHFVAMLNKSKAVFDATEGAFDPTIGPIVNFWGFGPEATRHADSSKVDSILAYTGFEKINLENRPFFLPKGFALDFNAIAQGYTVDVISEFLEGSGVSDYMVEVGGEVRCRGRNLKDKVWRIGVDKPTEKIDQQARFQFILELDSSSLATSGNYRKFWVDEETGVRYAHTINPATGFPANNRLLSASVVAHDAATADAYATAFMVMGTKKAVQFLNKTEERLEIYLISSSARDSTWEIYQSPGFEKMILNK